LYFFISSDGANDVLVVIDNVAIPMAVVANINMPTVKLSMDIDAFFFFIAASFPLSVSLDVAVSRPNIVEPRRQHAMKHEKTVPYGVFMAAAVVVVDDDANFRKYDTIAELTAGGQLSTNMYMAASNVD
jgi:hypothetical protein